MSYQQGTYQFHSLCGFTSFATVSRNHQLDCLVLESILSLPFCFFRLRRLPAAGHCSSVPSAGPAAAGLRRAASGYVPAGSTVPSCRRRHHQPRRTRPRRRWLLERMLRGALLLLPPGRLLLIDFVPCCSTGTIRRGRYRLYRVSSYLFCFFFKRG